MSAPHRLEDLAREDHWIALADALRAAMRDPEAYGLADRGAIVRRVAELRGARPASLLGPLAAAAWLETHAPEVHAARPPGIGRSHVELLRKLHKVDPLAAEKVAPEVFGGAIRRRDLKDMVAKASDRADMPARRARPEGNRRARSFHKTAERFVRAQLPALGIHGEAEVLEARKERIVPCDLEIRREGRPVLAVEIKAPRVRIARQYLVETLGVAALLLREFDRVLILAPRSWQGDAQDLAAICDALGLDGIGIALLEAAEGPAPEAGALQVVRGWSA